MSKKKESKKRTPCPQPVKETLWRSYFESSMVGECYVCKKSISFTNFEVGHNKSFTTGGTWDINNLRPICRSCNRSMGKMTIEDFKKKYFPKTPSPNGKISEESKTFL